MIDRVNDSEWETEKGKSDGLIGMGIGVITMIDKTKYVHIDTRWYYKCHYFGLKVEVFSSLWRPNIDENVVSVW